MMETVSSQKLSFLSILLLVLSVINLVIPQVLFYLVNKFLLNRILAIGSTEVRVIFSCSKAYTVEIGKLRILLQG